MSDTLSPTEIHVEVTDGIRLVTLDRPARLNAFTSTGYLQLTHALADADLDASVRVVLIRGAGRGFSSGVDLDALTFSDPEELRTRFADLVGTLAGMSKPVVAAPHGVAVGFGMTLLLLCDVVLVAEGCRLRAPFTALGTVPEAGSSHLLPALIGRQAAMDVVLSSRWIDSAETVRLGLAAARFRWQTSTRSFAGMPGRLRTSHRNRLSRRNACSPRIASRRYSTRSRRSTKQRERFRLSARGPSDGSAGIPLRDRMTTPIRLSARQARHRALRCAGR